MNFNNFKILFRHNLFLTRTNNLLLIFRQFISSIIYHLNNHKTTGQLHILYGKLNLLSARNNIKDFHHKKNISTSNIIISNLIIISKNQIKKQKEEMDIIKAAIIVIILLCLYVIKKYDIIKIYEILIIIKIDIYLEYAFKIFSTRGKIKIAF